MGVTLVSGDWTKLRQILQQLNRNTTDRLSVFLTYNEADLSATPADPPTSGDSEGWSTTPTANSKWISTKRAVSIDSGIWSTPIPFRGADGADGANGTNGTNGATGPAGADGVDGSAWSNDIPEVKNVRFSISSGNMIWTAGVVNYGGAEHVISAQSTPQNYDYFYWNHTSPTAIQATNTLATAIDIASGNWMLCQRKSGKAIPAIAHKVIIANSILTATLSAINASLGNITAGEILLSGANGAETTAANALYQLKVNAGGIQGRWRTTTVGDVWTTGSNGWRNIVDITGNEVKLSFDSFSSGDDMPANTPTVLSRTSLYTLTEKTVSATATDYDDSSFRQITSSIQDVCWAMQFKGTYNGSTNSTNVITPYLKNSGGTKVWTGESKTFRLTAAEAYPSYVGFEFIEKPYLQGIALNSNFKMGVTIQRTNAGTSQGYVQGAFKRGNSDSLSIKKT